MKKYAAVGLGNAIVDVLSQADDAFIEEMKIERGVMQLIDKDRGEELYEAMTNRVQAAGGSAGNTIACLGNLGLKSAFIGRVRDDVLGRFYAEELSAHGIDFPNAPVADDALPTSRSMIFVTPDGERSMNTYLGISSEFSTADLDEEALKETDILYLEGYLYDKPVGKEALERAAQICQDAGGIAGVTLSDPFCVERHRADFLRMSKTLDYVMGNKHEWASLYETDLESALTQAAKDVKLVVCTCSGDDVIVIKDGVRIDVPVNSCAPVDATGAGDAFAAGFLYGLWHNRDLTTCAKMGSIAAYEVINHFGARPEVELAELFREAGLI